MVKAVRTLVEVRDKELPESICNRETLVAHSLDKICIRNLTLCALRITHRNYIHRMSYVVLLIVYLCILSIRVRKK